MVGFGPFNGFTAFFVYMLCTSWSPPGTWLCKTNPVIIMVIPAIWSSQMWPVFGDAWIIMATLSQGPFGKAGMMLLPVHLLAFAGAGVFVGILAGAAWYGFLSD